MYLILWDRNRPPHLIYTQILRDFARREGIVQHKIVAIFKYNHACEAGTKIPGIVQKAYTTRRHWSI